MQTEARKIDTGGSSRLAADEVTLAYDAAPVVEALSLSIADGQVTSIVGPNGCGKSTLLRALARLLSPKAGSVYLDGQAIRQHPTKEVARRLGLLAQQATLPDAITVQDLVRRGRYPHHGLFQPPTREDERVVERAMALAGISDLRDQAVDELSGGQRQRAWIAMTLAQDTPILLPDEPTTYLDIAHQQEVLALVRRLRDEEGRTVVAVLHDVNHAARISDRIVAMRSGAVAAEAGPRRDPDAVVAARGLRRDLRGDPPPGRRPPGLHPGQRAGAVGATHATGTGRAAAPHSTGSATSSDWCSAVTTDESPARADLLARVPEVEVLTVADPMPGHVDMRDELSDRVTHEPWSRVRVPPSPPE